MMSLFLPHQRRFKLLSLTGEGSRISTDWTTGTEVTATGNARIQGIWCSSSSTSDMIPVHRFRYPYIRLAASYSSESANDPLPFDLLDIHRSSDLIRKQQWRALKFLTKSTNPNRFLQQLYDWNAPYDVVLRYFKWSEQEFQVSHSLEHYCKLFYVLANANRYGKIRSLLDDPFIKNAISKYSCCSILRMLEGVCDNVCANSIIVDLLILAYVKNSKTDFVFEAFDRAGDYGLKLSVISCNQLINLLVREEKFGRAEFVYREMIKRRIEVNLATFNMVINGLCKAGRLHKAEDVFEDMQVRGILPSVVTYNTLIDGYCKKGGAGKMFKADALMKEMVKRKIFPNNITYNALIDGFCKVENVSAAMNLFKKMQVSGLKPDVVTYNSLINGLCCLGKPDKALVLRDQMVESGVKPSLITYNVVMNGFSKKKMVKECKEVFDDISKQGLVPNTYTYNTLLNAYFQAGNLEEAAKLYKSMLEGTVSPNVSTYNSLIAGYSKDGDVQAVYRLVEKMKDIGLKANIVTYNIRIGALCKKGESREAIKLLNEMSRVGLIPIQLTYNTLISGYCGEGNLRAALNVMTRMEKEGRRPNVATYNVLIKAFCEKGETVRGVLQMLQGLSSGLFYWDRIRQGYRAKDGLYVTHLSQTSLRMVLDQFIHSATCLKLVEITLDKTEDTFATPTLRGFASSAFAWLAKLRDLASKEEVKMNHPNTGTAPTILGVASSLTSLCSGAEYLLHIAPGVVPKEYIEGDTRVSSDEMAVHILNSLYEKLNDACLVQGGEEDSYRMLLYIFVGCLLPYIEVLDSWIFEGILDDPFDEMFFYANKAIAIDEAEF